MKVGNQYLRHMWFLFVGIGIFFVIVGIVVFFFLRTPKENRIYVTGTITQIDRYDEDNDGEYEYDVYVKYRVNGTTMENKLNYYSRSMKKGKTIKIYYDLEDPTKISSDSGDSLVLIIPEIVGLVFFIVGVAGIYSSNKKKWKQKQLMETGNPIYATIKDVKLNNELIVKGASPYNIYCEWINPKDNSECIFKSENIWKNPIPILQQKNITTLKVFVDPNDKDFYIVDLSQIEEEL